jgi:hypothetical protein
MTRRRLQPFDDDGHAVFSTTTIAGAVFHSLIAIALGFAILAGLGTIVTRMHSGTVLAPCQQFAGGVDIADRQPGSPVADPENQQTCRSAPPRAAGEPR